MVSEAGTMLGNLHHHNSNSQAISTSTIVSLTRRDSHNVLVRQVTTNGLTNQKGLSAVVIALHSHEVTSC